MEAKLLIQKRGSTTSCHRGNPIQRQSPAWGRRPQRRKRKLTLLTEPPSSRFECGRGGGFGIDIPAQRQLRTYSRTGSAVCDYLREYRHHEKTTKAKGTPRRTQRQQRELTAPTRPPSVQRPAAKLAPSAYDYRKSAYCKSTAMATYCRRRHSQACLLTVPSAPLMKPASSCPCGGRTQAHLAGNEASSKHERIAQRQNENGGGRTHR